MFAWTNELDGRMYVVLVDNEELTDVDIMDSTDPSNPVMVNDTLNLALPPFSVGQDTPTNLTPSRGDDHVGAVRRHRVHRNVGEWNAVDQPHHRHLGHADVCRLRVLAERGGTPTACTFQQKLNNITAAGYSSGLVLNNLRPDCHSRVTMAAAGSIPFVFVNRLTGLRLLQAPGVTAANACTASPASGAASASTAIQAIFEGWGYVRLFGTEIPKELGASGSISQIDTYAIPESQDPAYATGFGALSVHEVAMDPEEHLAYISYYSGGRTSWPVIATSGSTSSSSTMTTRTRTTTNRRT